MRKRERDIKQGERERMRARSAKNSKANSNFVLGFWKGGVVEESVGSTGVW